MLTGKKMAQIYRRSANHPTETFSATMAEAAVLQAVAYSDIFDYPLTGPEIHRYMVGIGASLESVQDLLSGGSLSARLSHRSGFYLIPGRDAIVETRRRRSEVAASMWPRARQYGATIAQLPFVRMVAVTGALAMDNVDPNTDIDYLVVTEPGRLWLCRAMTVAFVRLAARRGDVICPNYFLSVQSLALGEPDIFTAHELVQMVPLAGLDTYQRMCRLNSWAEWYLPNAFNAPRRVEPDQLPAARGRRNGRSHHDGVVEKPLACRAAESILRSSVWASVEQWEMDRKVRKLGCQLPAKNESDPPAEVGLSSDCCKGHFDSHKRRTMEAYSQRLDRLAVAFPTVTGPEVATA